MILLALVRLLLDGSGRLSFSLARHCYFLINTTALRADCKGFVKYFESHSFCEEFLLTYHFYYKKLKTNHFLSKLIRNNNIFYEFELQMGHYEFPTIFNGGKWKLQISNHFYGSPYFRRLLKV